MNDVTNNAYDIIKHLGVEYSVNALIAIKGQGTSIRTNEDECSVTSSTIISVHATKPIVIKEDGHLIILIDTVDIRSKRTFDAMLLSKHIMKKAKIEPPKIIAPVIVDNRTATQRALAALSRPAVERQYSDWN